MTKVLCDETSCEHCKFEGGTYFVCGCDQIELESGEVCKTYINHTDISPEYRETFWKRMSSREDKHECKKEARGKRFEICGLIWFTDSDDRFGTDDIWFTEQRSGLRCQGIDITEEHASLMKKKIESICPVVDLPEATLDDL